MSAIQRKLAYFIAETLPIFIILNKDKLSRGKYKINLCIFAPMKMSEPLRKFIHDHAGDDLSGLLLSASRYKDVDVKAAVGQIAARARIKDKLPSWYNDDRLFFPSTLSTEQCSSEIAALYKQRLIQSDDCLCDLTGGLGVDTCFFAQKAGCAIYVERNEDYCDAARYNMNVLGVSNVSIINGDATDVVMNNDSRISDANVFYLDPARRGVGNKRMFAISDCEPNLTKIWPLLRERQCKVIVKLSPMLDIAQVLTQLPGACEVHVVSVKNECKELLVVSDAFANEESDVQIFCANYTSSGEEQLFRFSLSDEHHAVVGLAEEVGQFLYEPNSSIMKAGAYKSVALRYGVEKLHASSHLYTSNHIVSSFPGRIFEITDTIPFGSRVCKGLSSDIPQANISVRNFPISADDLRKRTRIVDGGDIYLFATTLSDNSKVLMKCVKASLEQL